MAGKAKKKSGRRMQRRAAKNSGKIKGSRTPYKSRSFLGPRGFIPLPKGMGEGLHPFRQLSVDTWW